MLLIMRGVWLSTREFQDSPTSKFQMIFLWPKIAPLTLAVKQVLITLHYSSYLVQKTGLKKEKAHLSTTLAKIHH